MTCFMNQIYRFCRDFPSIESLSQEVFSWLFLLVWRGKRRDSVTLGRLDVILFLLAKPPQNTRAVPPHIFLHAWGNMHFSM